MLISERICGFSVSKVLPVQSCTPVPCLSLGLLEWCYLMVFLLAQCFLSCENCNPHSPCLPLPKAEGVWVGLLSSVGFFSLNAILFFISNESIYRNYWRRGLQSWNATGNTIRRIFEKFYFFPLKIITWTVPTIVFFTGMFCSSHLWEDTTKRPSCISWALMPQCSCTHQGSHWCSTLHVFSHLRNLNGRW